ncbi:hypothetical protein A0H81_02763 [Grifola frondosa]|uniref:Uncharacterized protein n=1 Tax=Grifola frondosa TaxID=5627 RepID=A0A1C7MKP9_GRIFR|nr:hypothetical protein A0H81_02763 [Grifola frondosa]
MRERSTSLLTCTRTVYRSTVVRAPVRNTNPFRIERAAPTAVVFETTRDGNGKKTGYNTAPAFASVTRGAHRSANIFRVERLPHESANESHISDVEPTTSATIERAFSKSPAVAEEERDVSHCDVDVHPKNIAASTDVVGGTDTAVSSSVVDTARVKDAHVFHSVPPIATTFHGRRRSKCAYDRHAHEGGCRRERRRQSPRLACYHY